ncbi:MAG: UDP-galactopyranose mutase [Parasphingorhabdus sp.]
MSKVDYLIVGAGLFGSVFACEMNKIGRSCLVIEKRNHIGGNCFTENRDGIDIHVYGPHIFHTSSDEVWDYVRRFVDFNDYKHTGCVSNKGIQYSFPINLKTMQQAYGIDDVSGLSERLEDDRAPYRNTDGSNLEQWCLAQVGPNLYEKLIRGYTKKHWNKAPSELDASIIKRLPIRKTADDNYYFDKYQGIPEQGYTALFNKLLDGIDIRLDVDYFADRTHWDNSANTVVYTGEIDRFFNYAEGVLEWRSLRFELSRHERPDVQGRSVVNYNDPEIPYTRIVEHKHFNLNATRNIKHSYTTYEYPAELADTGEAFYPVPTEANRKCYKRYVELTRQLGSRYIFGGRLANYVYIDMAPAIQMALNLARKEQLVTV